MLSSTLLVAIPCLLFVAIVASAEQLTRKPCEDYCRYKTSGIPDESRPGLRIRKDVKCLTAKEWERFSYAVNKVHDKGIFDQFSRIHDKYFHSVHDKAEFLPWHRWFIFEMESELRKIDPSVTLPYWDAAVDGERPEQSVVLTADYFGTEGHKESSYCVKDGISADWIRHFPQQKCLRRQYMPSKGHIISPWHSPEFMTHVLQAGETFDNFRILNEFSIHPFVHNNLGDQKGDLNDKWASNDPLFYLIHTNADRLWAKWQLAEERNYYDYSGPWLDRFSEITHYTASLQKNLTYYDIPVLSAMKFGSPSGDGMPFTYDELLNEEIDATASTAAKRLMDTLPEDVLQYWFPKFADGSVNRFYVDLPPTCNVHGDDEHLDDLVQVERVRRSLDSTPNRAQTNFEDEKKRLDNRIEGQSGPSSDIVYFDKDTGMVQSLNETKVHRLVMTTQFDYDALIARGFDPWRIRQVEIENNNFVEGMGEIDYSSPY